MLIQIVCFTKRLQSNPCKAIIRELCFLLLHLSVPGAVAALSEEREQMIYVLLLFNLSSSVTTIPTVGLLTLFIVFKLTEKILLLKGERIKNDKQPDRLCYIL